jgi:glycosyltransferase involved in cell wall biosynthesis
VPTLSIVMPVRNGAHLLEAQLDALCVSIGVRDDVEVVIADNGSTDDTALIARTYEDRLRIRVVDASRSPGINVARNVGVRATTGERILLCDADDEADAGWIEAMIAAFDDGGRLLAGRIDYQRLNDATTCRWRGAEGASVYEAVGFLPTGHGANAGFMRSVFDAVDGFDEAFRAGGDDTDFFWRGQLAGFELREVSDAVVHYRLRPDLSALWRQFFDYAATEAQLAKKFRGDGLRRRQITAPLRDIWWLLSRAPFAAATARRGAWVRRCATFCGRFRGACRHRVVWW